MAQDGRTDRDRTEHGNYAEEYPPERFLAVFDDRPFEPLTSREVADIVGCTRKTAFAKLTILDDQDRLKTKKVGRIRLWWSGGEAE